MCKEWFILQFKPNSHHQAARNLTNQGFDTFLPLYNFTSRKKNLFMNVTRPLFPGYMFVSFDRKNAMWSKINNTYGVSRLITFNNTLKSIPNSFINDLKINSANLVDVVLDVEDEFDIEIDNDSMEKMLSVKAAIEIIESKLAES